MNKANKWKTVKETTKMMKIRMIDKSMTKKFYLNIIASRYFHFIAKIIIIFFFYEKIPAVALAENLLSAPQQPHADQTVIKREQTLLQDEPRPPPPFHQTPIIILTQRSRIIFFKLARSFLHNHHLRAAEAQIKTGP